MFTRNKPIHTTLRPESRTKTNGVVDFPFYRNPVGQRALRHRISSVDKINHTLNEYKLFNAMGQSLALDSIH